MGKLIKFVKENKTITFSLLIVVLSFAFLAIPGFVKFQTYLNGSWKYSLNGYQFFFNTAEVIGGTGAKLGRHVVGQGIAIIVMLAAAIAGLIFSKKSSFVLMLTGLDLLVVSILFYSIAAKGNEAYEPMLTFGYKYGWVTFVLGSLVLIAAGLLIYKTVLVMKDEIKHPSKPQGPSYSYLKK